MSDEAPQTRSLPSESNGQIAMQFSSTEISARGAVAGITASPILRSFPVFLSTNIKNRRHIF